MTGKYILKGTKPIPCDDLMIWGEFLEGKGNRRVAETKIGKSTVSTVFLGLDHQFGDGPPLLFETMVFGGPLDQATDRYPTWKEAEKGHDQIVAEIKDATP